MASAWLRSPNGTLLAVGSFDNKIYVYAADQHYSLRYNFNSTYNQAIL